MLTENSPLPATVCEAGHSERHFYTVFQFTLLPDLHHPAPLANALVREQGLGESNRGESRTNLKEKRFFHDV
jgi:hypothetical protein